MPESAHWHVTGASTAGTSHIRAGRPCDDAHDYRILTTDQGTELLLIAVADGAGSAAQAARGAKAVVETASEAAARLLLQQHEPANEEQWRDALAGILTATRAELINVANEVGVSVTTKTGGTPNLRDFATTLLLTLITSNWIAAVQVGDGAVVIQRVGGLAVSLTSPSQSKYINETNFVTDDDYREVAEYTVLPRGALFAVALLTDGLQMLAMKFPGNIPHQPFFAPLFKFAANAEAPAEELQRFLESERVCQQTDDDKTLVLAVYQ